jgi:ubiquinone/menaquinone biosynthesis C-methylase UbiE/malonyl CoA-acyl carrier protein transacylase
MPLCCALQIALVCLLRSWNVHPTAVVGHSSGESAAAFAAGAIDMRSAIAVQYYRGLLTGRLAGARSNKGSMMAAGLSLEDAEQYLSNITSGKAVVGCHNSPLSVTLSGDADAIDELEILLKVDGVFTRKLNVPTAFHSHHMSHDATQYLNYLEECFTAPQDPLLAHLSSSVTGGWCEKASDFGPEHWVDYMLKPVRFADALLKLCSERPWDEIFKKGQKAVDVLIEIGPHGALAAPVRQSLQSTQFKDLQIGYVSALKRNENAVHTMHDLVSSLWTRGYPVDLAVVNSTETQRNRPQVHTTLTPYPWNYQSKLRAESSIAKRYRLRPVGPDELIGFLDTSCDLSNPSWTNNFEPEKLSHDGEQVCSVGVYCSLAGRAIQELASWQQTNGNSNAATPRFRHVEIHEDLHIDDAQLTKLHVELRRSKLGPEPIAEIWRVFTISSEDSSGMWTLHCDGLVGLATTYEGNPDVFSQAGSLAKSSLPPMDSLTRTKPAEASIWELEKATIKEHERQLHEDSQLVALTFMEEALQDLQENPPRRMLPHHRAYKRMITSIVGEARSSQKTSQSTKWAGMFTTGKDELKNRVRVSSTNGQVICCLGENLSQILRGLTDPDEVLSKNHLTKGLLESPSERRSLGQMRAVISKMARESPGIRALQIGAGTKHDTKSILEALSAQRGTQLLVADKCKNRVEHLRTQFKAQENTVTFVQLDIGSATCDPSFEAGSFDLVVAYQAFHECKDIKIALKNVSRLMKPGGKLLFAETTTPLLDMRLCLAVHPSWYIGMTSFMALHSHVDKTNTLLTGSEPERKLNPYLSARQWASLLPEVGFGSIDEKLRDCESDDHHSIHLMQATRLLKNSDPAENHSSNLQASCFTQLWRPDVDLISSSQIKDLICNRTVKSSDHLPLDLLEYVCLVYMSEILPWLEQADNLQHAQSGHWQLYAQWIRNCIQQHPSLDAKGPLVEAKIKFARQTIASSESGSIVLGMIDQIGKNIRKIFTREIETLQVMVEGDLHRFYRSAFGISANPSIAQYIGLIADKKQGIRILEIGGGSGGTTYDVLERLRNEDGTSKAILYRFTDISSGFLGKAAEKFSRDSAIMEFSKYTPSLSICKHTLSLSIIPQSLWISVRRHHAPRYTHNSFRIRCLQNVLGTLNIEKDPSTQGLEEQQFDVIVAANVLHATPNLQKTLKNCHKLLKPNGKLVLGEITERCLYAGFIMGSLPGWWLGENDGRTGGPLLDVAGWDVSLKKAGFSGVDLDMQGINGESPEPMSLVVSTKTPVSKVNGISASKYTIITSGTPICTAFAESIRLALDTENSETDIIAWSDFKAEDIQGSYCISLAEWDAPILATITDKDWQRLRTLMYKSLGTLWVTAGAAMDAPNPSASLMTGLARVFRHEHDNLAFATMDVQLADVIELPVASTAVMRVAITHSHAAQLDSEFAARGPVIYVPRVERASNMSNMLPDVKAHGTQDPIPHTNGVVKTEVSSDATYIIAGIGGIGREIGCWLAKKGAKHLVLLSRSATSYKENVIYAKDLYKNHGTSAWLFDCDIADRTALQKVLANIGHLPPVKGVINGAMVMKVCLIYQCGSKQY